MNEFNQLTSPFFLLNIHAFLTFIIFTIKTEPHEKIPAPFCIVF
jgi:hypothetical protein